MSKTIGIDKDIKITDSIKFILSTTDSDGCLKDPYKINKAVIYFISREFAETSVSEYSNQIYDSSLVKKYEEQKSITCVSPSVDNINKLSNIKEQLENSKFTSPFFFKEAIPIKIFGGYENEPIGVGDLAVDPFERLIEEEVPPYEGEIFPAWLNPDLVPVEVKSKVEEDNILSRYEENGVYVEGKFVLDWNPIGCREGDYFICWNWNPNLAGDSLSAHMVFSLGADTRITSSIPAHRTKKDKYEILMERYLPQMFKNLISENDLTPYVVQELNNSIAKGFTFIEDMANQIIDLLDANSTHEQFLPLLSNIFNLRLKSNDPTLWRRQIKKAISNFKKKGTTSGLKSALSDAGINFLGMTKLWQINSKYTYQEHFTKTTSLNKFKIKKQVILPINENNFELWIRRKESKDWEQLDSSYVDFQEENLEYYCVWIGEDLEIGDSIRILYQVAIIPDEDSQNIEYYIRELDLMDQRDERDQEYPIKNWNTRVIEESDPLFDIIIPVKHPIQDPVIWGKVRTEFPYSENVYNMEEYNGSTRDSFDPCDINKDFIDVCKDCQASSFLIDVEIEDLSNDRILECQKTIEEFVPFHSLIHSINFLGARNEFIKPPLENLQILIQFSKEETLISGEAQHIFNRSISREDRNLVKRNMLALMEDKTGVATGVGMNRSIMLFAPSFSTRSDLDTQNFSKKSSGFFRKNIDIENVDESYPFDNSNLLEILSPSANAGNYSISKVYRDSLDVVSKEFYTISEPLNKSQFEFRISNKIHEQTVDILQSDITVFGSNFNFSEIKIKTQKDIDEETETGLPYKVRLNDSEYYEYDILEILPDNKLIINGPLNSEEFSTSVTNINWKLIDPSADLSEQILESGSGGFVNFIKRGLIDLSPAPPPFSDVRQKIKIGDYLLLDNNQYRIKSFAKNEDLKFYIDGYSNGNVGGTDVIIYRRVIENCVGQLDYKGLSLRTSENYESVLGIQNGKNSLDTFTKSSDLKENYLILIDSDYYSIIDIDGTNITLDGPNNDWTTLGTDVEFSIYKFTKQPVSISESIYPKIPGHDFEEINRQNNEIIENQTAITSPFLASKVLNSINSKNEFIDSSGQVESIKFEIEYKKDEE